jgi:hypothetical protein
MAQSYLLFDFGANEESAQHARHRIEGWKQAFRLGKKMELKFDRKEPEKSGGKKKAAEGGENIRLIVRLDFSDHEKLTHQRWLDRIPSEEPFKSVSGQVVRHDESDFAKTAELFDSLS